MKHLNRRRAEQFISHRWMRARGVGSEAKRDEGNDGRGESVQSVDNRQNLERFFLIWWTRRAPNRWAAMPRSVWRWPGQSYSSHRQINDDSDQLPGRMASLQSNGCNGGFPLEAAASTKRFARELWSLAVSLSEALSSPIVGSTEFRYEAYCQWINHSRRRNDRFIQDVHIENEKSFWIKRMKYGQDMNRSRSESIETRVKFAQN
jgi:hypothetical protein